MTVTINACYLALLNLVLEELLTTTTTAHAHVCACRCILQISKRMPLADKLIAAYMYKVIGNSQIYIYIQTYIHIYVCIHVHVCSTGFMFACCRSN